MYNCKESKRVKRPIIFVQAQVFVHLVCDVPRSVSLKEPICWKEKKARFVLFSFIKQAISHLQTRRISHSFQPNRPNLAAWSPNEQAARFNQVKQTNFN